METCGLSLCFSPCSNKYCTELYINFPLLNYTKYLVEILGKGKFIHHRKQYGTKNEKIAVQTFNSVQSKKIIFVKNISELPNSIPTGLKNTQHSF